MSGYRLPALTVGWESAMANSASSQASDAPAGGRGPDRSAVPHVERALESRRDQAKSAIANRWLTREHRGALRKCRMRL
jgi:hypothetical protein